MGQVRLFLNAALLFVASVLSDAQTASAQSSSGWTLCNQTSFIIEAATARPVGQSVVVEGWTKLRPGACAIAAPAPLVKDVHFIYARSSTAHRGGNRNWGGENELCVDTTGSFSIESPPVCASMGLDERRFRPVLIERSSSWRTNLKEIEDYSLDRARQAGVQRLLKDADVYTGRIDGDIGRRTRAAIREFLKEQGLDQDTSDADLIDILEQAAIARARNVGMTLCNRTNNRIWASIGRRRGEGWESRGWWILEGQGCARVIDEPLLQTQHYVYAEMDNNEDNSYRTLRETSKEFCVTRSKFAIVAIENCEASAYRTADFFGTTIPEDGKLVFEFFDRNFDETPRER